MSKFINYGRNYINLNNIIRFTVTKRLTSLKYDVNAILKENTSTFIFGNGTFENEELTLNTFHNEQDAHTWIKTILKDDLKR